MDVRYQRLWSSSPTAHSLIVETICIPVPTRSEIPMNDLDSTLGWIYSYDCSESCKIWLLWPWVRGLRCSSLWCWWSEGQKETGQAGRSVLKTDVTYVCRYSPRCTDPLCSGTCYGHPSGFNRVRFWPLFIFLPPISSVLRFPPSSLCTHSLLLILDFSLWISCHWGSLL
jgi:hypothetical protein